MFSESQKGFINQTIVMNKVITPYLKELNNSDALPEGYSCLIIECQLKDDGNTFDHSIIKVGDYDLIAEALLADILLEGDNPSKKLMEALSELLTKQKINQTQTQKEKNNELNS